ncbi:cytochrome d ubiquinol oxidase subunit II [Blastococcus sp. Marseille-P5729]|uniref:cytochrome d ubiquinol oxidase subunit II n=1 Tax=Blastococcus sp. Marseille-P5729 TaxID=2086582 RepID=UPI000D10542A|nr:cytochrome d ubiquinol oxidase subunit II [Blastococcus sp. Marseille-P5729]
MTLVDFWFYLIAVLWIGYFFLEGFDFGVGMLLPILSKDERDRRVIINTIGPVWDGNEVWLLTAGGATFAAFPLWYATLFSGFFLPLLLILLALIVRGVAFEYRGKGDPDSKSWKRGWDICIGIGSWVPAILWGVAFANLVRGVPLGLNDNGNIDYTGGFFNLLNPYALVGGLTTLLVFLLHGAVFLALKTAGSMQRRAEDMAKKIGYGALAVGGVFIVWTILAYGSVVATILLLLAAVALLGALLMIHAGREGWAFALLGVTIATFVAGLFVALYPNVMPDINGEHDLTAEAAASSSYTLTVMTWVAVIMTPIVLAYQAWTYWVFRKRITRKSIPADRPKTAVEQTPEVARDNN